jgi:thioredoxin:protein disulfide reductase
VILLLCLGVTVAVAQGILDEPVFQARLVADHEPLVAGESARLAVVVTVERGWHINSDDPGDDFSVPTTMVWKLPEGWLDPVPSFPDGEKLRFDFSETPIEVWQGRVLIPVVLTVPEGATGPVRLTVGVTAQACNSSQCLAPTDVTTTLETTVAPPGTVVNPTNADLFSEAQAPPQPADAQGTAAGAQEAGRLAAKSLPLLLIGVFLGGLALNLTPCVFPLIPITIGFFAQQTKERSGGTFWLALAYMIGIAATYSVLGVLAALGGALFGSALQSPWVVGVIVAVLLALAASMFGLWELRVPGWAQRASGGRTGVVGALLMGLIMGFIAAPCIGPFVIGLLTLVGQRGDPVFGFTVFFTLALGLGLPYLLLGTFTGLVNRLPSSGMWMVGVRRLFGVLLIAMAAYFAAPQLPAAVGGWLMPVVLVLGALYLLVIDRTGHEQPAIDRSMRLASAVMLAAGVVLAPTVRLHQGGGETAAAGHLDWAPYEASAVSAAIAAGGPVIVDFAADWCAPCKELDAITFADPGVRELLEGFTRFKVDLTRANATNQVLQREYSVRGVPTVVVWNEGAERFRITGFEPAERFMGRLRRATGG